MEIYTDRQGEIILKKYSPIGELDIFAKEYTEALFQTTGFTVCITDRDQVVAAAGPGSRELTGKSISRELEKVIAERSTKSFNAGAGERKKIPITENQKEMRNSGIIQPVVSSSDAIGAVILIGKNERDIIGNAERMLVQTAAGFLGKQIEQ